MGPPSAVLLLGLSFPARPETGDGFLLGKECPMGPPSAVLLLGLSFPARPETGDGFLLARE